MDGTLASLLACRFTNSYSPILLSACIMWQAVIPKSFSQIRSSYTSELDLGSQRPLQLRRGVGLTYRGRAWKREIVREKRKRETPRTQPCEIPAGKVLTVQIKFRCEVIRLLQEGSEQVSGSQNEVRITIHLPTTYTSLVFCDSQPFPQLYTQSLTSLKVLKRFHQFRAVPSGRIPVEKMLEGEGKQEATLLWVTKCRQGD